MQSSTNVAPHRDLVHHGPKAVAELLLMPHLRATALAVSKSEAALTLEKCVRIVDPGLPAAEYLIGFRGTQSFRLATLVVLGSPPQDVASRIQQTPTGSRGCTMPSRPTGTRA